MTNLIVEYLQSDMECKGLLECLHRLKQLGRRCLGVLVEADDRLAVDEVTEAAEWECSTIYRFIQCLLQADLVQKQQVSYEHGSYYHVYHPTNPNEVVNGARRMLNDWYAQMDTLIQRLRNRYNGEIVPVEQVFSTGEQPPSLDWSASQTS